LRCYNANFNIEIIQQDNKMFPKMLTTSQHKKNKKQKIHIERKKRIKNIKNEIRLLSAVKNIPEDIIPVLYSYLNNNIKFNLSHYKELFTKYIFDYNSSHNLSNIFRGYINYNYCTHDRTASPLKDMLLKIPLDKLQKYLYSGTPSKYFNIAFPLEPKIQEYFIENYKINDITTKDDKMKSTIYKNYIFEILDLISYFSTKANEYHSMKCNNKYLNNNKYLSQLQLIRNTYANDDYKKITEEFCRENEKIVRIIILSILYIYDKYGN